MVKIALIVLGGVILDTRYTAQHFSLEHLGHSLSITSDTYDVYSMAQLTPNPKEFIKEFTFEHRWTQIPLLPGAKEGLHKLRESGYKVFIISQIEKHLQDPIEHYLKSQHLEFDAFIATGRPTAEKQNMFNLFFDILKPQIFIFSSLDNIKGINQHSTVNAYVNPTVNEANTTIKQYSSLNEFMIQRKNLIK